MKVIPSAIRTFFAALLTIIAFAKIWHDIGQNAEVDWSAYAGFMAGAAVIALLVKAAPTDGRRKKRYFSDLGE